MYTWMTYSSNIFAHSKRTVGVMTDATICHRVEDDRIDLGLNRF